MSASPVEIDTLAPVFLAGPTAVGKSSLALEVAERIGGEIISVDSMQVYRGLNIGTAKPTSDERARVQHHLLDVADLHESFDAAQFVRLASVAVQDIQSRGRTPVFCGGTGLYFKGYLEGLGTGPESDLTLRAQLEATPLPHLLEELARLDPVAFGQIDRQNPRRVIRAVEVIRLTGKPFSAQKSTWSHSQQTSEAPFPRFFGLSRSPDDLRHRIDLRVDEMFQLGLVDETRALLERGLEQNRTAMQAIGYRQVVEHLRGEHSLAETIELVKIRTRQFAKRQMTWFRRQARLSWLELAPDESAAAAAQRLISTFSDWRRTQPVAHSPRDEY